MNVDIIKKVRLENSILVGGGGGVGRDTGSL
jgi:hypothetical protein